MNILKYIIVIALILLLIDDIIISNIQYDNHVFKGFLDNDMIESMKNCFNYKDDEQLNCFYLNQEKIFSKLKNAFNVNYISVGHARWSGNDNSKNYDAQSYHRDIKQNIFKHKGKYPNVYTFVCFLDKAIHFQGGKKYTFEPGDCMLFNAFNLHKGVNILSSNRRVIQFFHVFLDEKEKNDFYEKHTYAEHYDNDFIIKKFSKYIDYRKYIELLNLITILLPMKFHEPEKNTYVTLVDNYKLFANINGVKYYSKF